MPFQINSTKDIANLQHINALIYGQSGVGKTVLASTAPKPLLLDTEAGLLSLSHLDVASATIKKLADLKAAYSFLSKEEHEFESVCIDSLSELAEQVLVEYKAEERDPRAAYGRMAEEIFAIVRQFKKLPLHVFFLAKQARIEDAFTGKSNFGPSFPGQQLQANLPYHLDLVIAMRIGQKEGVKFRYLQTQPDVQYDAKDRTGTLGSKEKPNLTDLITKIQTTVPVPF